MSLDQETLRRKNEELSLAYKEKNRKLLQTSELYDKLKRKSMLGHIQDAASDAVETTLHGGLALGSHPINRVENQVSYDQQFGTPYGPTRYTDRLDQPAPVPAQPRMPPPDIRNSAWPQQAFPPGKDL